MSTESFDKNFIITDRNRIKEFKDKLKNGNPVYINEAFINNNLKSIFDDLKNAEFEREQYKADLIDSEKDCEILKAKVAELQSKLDEYNFALDMAKSIAEDYRKKYEEIKDQINRENQAKVTR